jgi:hypothetical protein
MSFGMHEILSPADKLFKTKSVQVSILKISSVTRRYALGNYSFKVVFIYSFGT